MFVEFPIIGFIRAPLLIIEWIFANITFELGLIFILKYRKTELKNLQELGYASMFFGYSGQWYFNIWSDYYSSQTIIHPFYLWSQGSYRLLFLNLGYFSVMVGALFFIYFIEKYKIVLYRKFFFTFCFLLLILICTIAFFINLTLNQSLTVLLWPIFLFFYIFFVFDLVKKAQKEKLFYGSIKLIIPVLALAGGYLLTRAIMTDIFGLTIRLIGSLLQLVSISLMYYVFGTIPPFSEFEWKDKIEDIYLIEKGGIALFHKNFLKRKSDLVEDHLISGAISTVSIMLQEFFAEGAPEKEGFSIIKKKGKIIIIYSGEFVNCVVICKEELNFIKYYIKKFVQKFETLYHNVLVEWNGDTNIFSPVETLIDDYFSR